MRNSSIAVVLVNLYSINVTSACASSCVAHLPNTIFNAHKITLLGVEFKLVFKHFANGKLLFTPEQGYHDIIAKLAAVLKFSSNRGIAGIVAGCCL